MAEHGTAQPSEELRELANRHGHLREHLQWARENAGEFPLLIEESSSEYESKRPNVIYHVGGPIFCHIYGDLGVPITYYAIEPELREEDRPVYGEIRDQILKRSVTTTAPSTDSEYTATIDRLLDRAVRIQNGTTPSPLTRLADYLSERIQVSERTFERIRYRLIRDIVGFGPLEPLMRDPANEDIHVIGPDEVYVDHSVYGLLETSVEFGDPEEYDSWLRNMGERIGDPVSDANPIVDSTLPDGSRINIIYSDDVSIKGPSLTIRQGEAVPPSITEITKWGTLSPRLAAYLWLCLENERTVFVVGETASGKTTTLNAIMSFIPRNSKIYTAEDTAEVRPPHDTWQQLLTREGMASETGEVAMFDLVAAALRSRPDYIVVGEVRGEEGRMAFQAAQTGHPILLTFHASDIVSMVQRFTGDPINVPETFMDNADVALFQNRVKRGDEVLRRVTSVQEIEGYSEDMDGVVTREVFHWDPTTDEIVFQGFNNSHVLENKIATLLGYADTRDIYDDLDFRTRIIEQLIEEDVLEYDEVNEAIAAFQRDGAEGLPFDIHA